MNPEQEKTAYRVLVEGRVTGVGFRITAVHEAGRIGNIEGAIRNMDNRTVEAIVQGPPGAVTEMLAWLRHGPSSATVTSVTITEVPVNDRLGPFQIAW